VVTRLPGARRTGRSRVAPVPFPSSPWRARAAEVAADAGDDRTDDLLVSDVIRTNERQVWFAAEHVVPAPLVDAE